MRLNKLDLYEKNYNPQGHLKIGYNVQIYIFVDLYIIIFRYQEDGFKWKYCELKGCRSYQKNKFILQILSLTEII